MLRQSSFTNQRISGFELKCYGDHRTYQRGPIRTPGSEPAVFTTSVQPTNLSKYALTAFAPPQVS